MPTKKQKENLQDLMDMHGGPGGIASTEPREERIMSPAEAAIAYPKIGELMERGKALRERDRRLGRQFW